MLRSGNKTLVKCPCALPTSEAPVLSVDMVADAEDVVWIRSLQSMLHDYDPEEFPHSAITGVLRRADGRAGRRGSRRRRPVGRPTRAWSTSATWQILTDRICRIYEY